MEYLGDSDSTSEVDYQTKTWETELSSRLSLNGDASATADEEAKCGIGHRVVAGRSVLALAIDEECVFAGLQGGSILAWSLETYDLVLSIHTHHESVLGLYLSDDGSLLFSSGSDSVVNLWSTRTFEKLYSIYSYHDVGDIFAVVYSSSLNTVYCGSQNTSIQWCDLSNTSAAIHHTSSAHPSKRRHRFFDSRGPDGRCTPQPESGAEDQQHKMLVPEGGKAMTFKRDHHKLFSHHGYIYAMLLVKGLVESSPSEETLLTGSGDGQVKIWRLGIHPDAEPMQAGKLNNADPVLSLAVDGSFLYVGVSGGALNIWNLDSRQLVRRIAKDSGDLWAVDIIRSVAICGDSNGIVKVTWYHPLMHGSA